MLLRRQTLRCIDVICSVERRRYVMRVRGELPGESVVSSPICNNLMAVDSAFVTSYLH